MISVILTATLLLSEASPAAASAPVVTAPAATKVQDAKLVVVPPKIDRDTVVCHPARVPGSLIPQKLCYSQAQMEDRRQQDQMMLNQMQRPVGAGN